MGPWDAPRMGARPRAALHFTYHDAPRMGDLMTGWWEAPVLRTVGCAGAVVCALWSVAQPLVAMWERCCDYTIIAATNLSHKSYAIAKSCWQCIVSSHALSWHVTRPYALMANPQHRVHTIFVDSMALRFISATRNVLVRVTDARPQAFVDTASGTIPVDAVAGINVQCREGKWHYLELPDAHVCSKATVELYPVQMAFTILGARH